MPDNIKALCDLFYKCILTENVVDENSVIRVIVHQEFEYEFEFSKEKIEEENNAILELWKDVKMSERLFFCNSVFKLNMFGARLLLCYNTDNDSWLTANNIVALGIAAGAIKSVPDNSNLFEFNF